MPQNVRCRDQRFRFPRLSHEQVKRVIDECRRLSDVACSLYDSDAYLDDVVRFIAKQPFTAPRANEAMASLAL